MGWPILGIKIGQLANSGIYAKPQREKSGPLRRLTGINSGNLRQTQSYFMRQIAAKSDKKVVFVLVPRVGIGLPMRKSQLAGI